MSAEDAYVLSQEILGASHDPEFKGRFVANGRKLTDEEVEAMRRAWNGPAAWTSTAPVVLPAGTTLDGVKESARCACGRKTVHRPGQVEVTCTTCLSAMTDKALAHLQDFEPWWVGEA